MTKFVVADLFWPKEKQCAESVTMKYGSTVRCIRRVGHRGECSPFISTRCTVVNGEVISITKVRSLV